MAHKVGDLMKKFISTYSFSNKDYFDKPINVKFIPDQIIKKVNDRMYGLCMELNYVFYEMLIAAGYECYLIKCLKPKNKEEYFDIFHMAILLVFNKEKYFVDVGFGEHFQGPILLENELVDNVYEIIINNKVILKVFSEPINEDQINENYVKFFSSGPDDFPLCRILYERIYDMKTKQYIEIKLN